MISCLASVFVVFAFDVTKNLQWFDGVPFVGRDSRVRNDIASLAIIVAITSFPAASYWMMQEVLLANHRLDEQVEKLQTAEALLRDQVNEIREAREVLKRNQEELERLVAERTARLRETIQELERFSYSISMTCVPRCAPWRALPCWPRRLARPAPSWPAWIICGGSASPRVEWTS